MALENVDRHESFGNFRIFSLRHVAMWHNELLEVFFGFSPLSLTLQRAGITLYVHFFPNSIFSGRPGRFGGAVFLHCSGRGMVCPHLEAFGVVGGGHR